LPALLSTSLDRDPARTLRGLGLRNDDCKHPVLEIGPDLIGLDAERQTQAALEGAKGPFGEMRVLPLLSPFHSLLGTDGQQVVVERDIDFFLRYTGQFDGDADLVLALARLHTRHQEPALSPSSGRALVGAEYVIEQPVHLALEKPERFHDEPDVHSPGT
jgi:hypothetical protein